MSKRRPFHRWLRARTCPCCGLRFTWWRTVKLTAGRFRLHRCLDNHRMKRLRQFSALKGQSDQIRSFPVEHNIHQSNPIVTDPCTDLHCSFLMYAKSFEFSVGSTFTDIIRYSPIIYAKPTICPPFPNRNSPI